MLGCRRITHLQDYRAITLQTQTASFCQTETETDSSLLAFIQLVCENQCRPWHLACKKYLFLLLPKFHGVKTELKKCPAQQCKIQMNYSAF